MNLVTKLALITVVTLMAACAPVEQKPLVTAPIASASTKPENSVTNPVIKEVVEEKSEAPVAKDLIAPAVEAVSDEAVTETTEETVITPIEKTEETIAEIIKEPVAPPPPLPDPFDPATLIGASPASLQTTLGRHDYSFDNSGMSVHHYRQEACLLLVFINQADEITHIDLRHQLVNQQIDITACHQELGARKDAVK